MARSSLSLARWLKLGLACVALAALAPAPSVASATAVVRPVGQVEGGSARPDPATPRLRAARYAPPAGRRPLARVAERRAGPPAARARAARDRLFLRHRALLR